MLNAHIFWYVLSLYLSLPMMGMWWWGKGDLFAKSLSVASTLIVLKIIQKYELYTHVCISNFANHIYLKFCPQVSSALVSRSLYFEFCWIIESYCNQDCCSNRENDDVDDKNGNCSWIHNLFKAHTNLFWLWAANPQNEINHLWHRIPTCCCCSSSGVICRYLVIIRGGWGKEAANAYHTHHHHVTENQMKIEYHTHTRA